MSCQIQQSHAALIMSYYTAPSNFALTPLRLSVALRGDTLQDTEIQRFVDRDLRAILSGIPELAARYCHSLCHGLGRGKTICREHRATESTHRFWRHYQSSVVNPCYR